MSNGLLRDVAAFEAAGEDFEHLHGEEAHRRWEALGAESGDGLVEQQVSVTRRLGPAPEVWHALAWEIQLRIDLVEAARGRERGRS